MAPREVVLLRHVVADDVAARKFLASAKKGRRRDLQLSVCWIISLLIFLAAYVVLVASQVVNNKSLFLWGVVGLGVSGLLAVVITLLTRRLVDYRVAASAMVVATHLRWTMSENGDWRHRQRTVIHLRLLGQRFRKLYPVVGVPLFQSQLRESQHIVLAHGARVIDSYTNDILTGDVAVLSAAREDMARVFLRCMGKHPHEVAHLRPEVLKPSGVGLRALLRQVRWGAVAAAVILFAGAVISAAINANGKST